jgi:hypothetical protein
LVKIIRREASCIETFRDQGHELFDMSHLICDGRRREQPITAGKADVDQVEVSSARTNPASVMIITTQQAQVHTAPPGANRPYRDNPLGVILSCREVRSSSPDIDLQRSSARPSAIPCPHSTTVIDSATAASRSRS